MKRVQTWSWLILVLLVLGIGEVSAKKKLPKTVVRAWTLPEPLGLADTVEVDSTFKNFPMRNELYDLSICNIYNGNLVSPTMSAIYFNRTHKTQFFFGDAYDIYTPTPHDVRFYNTTTPYSSISYKRGFKTYHEDDELKFFFTGNVTKRFNLGTTLNYTNAVGHYRSQSGKTFNGSVFGSFNGDHYSLQAAFTFNNMSSFENGGLTDPSQISNSEMETEDIPTNLNAMTGYRYLSGYLNHYYSICVEREQTVHYRERDSRGRWMDLDSTRIIYVPVTTFRHVFEVSDQTRRYIEKGPQTFYSNNYYNLQSTRDSAAYLLIKNTLSITFEEEFNTKLKFGATVFVMHEAERHLFGSGRGVNLSNGTIHYNDVLSSSFSQMNQLDWRYEWGNSLIVGGELYKNRGKYVHYGFGGNVAVVGARIGEFKVFGHLNAGFRLGKDSMTIDAKASFGNETPDSYAYHYWGNHARWGYSDNTYDEIKLTKMYRFHVGGQVAYPTKWITPRIKVDYENISRYVYFDVDHATPQQMASGKSISVLAADVELDITTPWLNLDNHVIYQYASDGPITVPTISLYTNLYYHGVWFKALDAQIGIDLRYNTRYYAPIWNPAIGQFCAQNKEKVGNYPTLSAYVNFYVRLLHLRFFAMYQHWNTTIMSRYYFTMPGYPENPDVFRAGLAFHFYK